MKDSEENFNILWSGVCELKIWKISYEQKLENGIRIDYDKYKKIKAMHDKRNKELADMLRRINMYSSGSVMCMPPMLPPRPSVKGR